MTRRKSRRSPPSIGAIARLPLLALAGLALGGITWFYTPVWGTRLWLLTLIGTGGIVVLRTVRRALAGQWTSDVVATLAIVTAAVMQQPLAGVIIVIMQTGGEALEQFAEGRASAAVEALEADRPQRAHVLRDDIVRDVAAGDARVGDLLVVRPGELVPCDGVVTQGTSQLDTSRLTGEPLPESIAPGIRVRSGSINGSRPFTMRVTAVAAQSQYARIVELVRAAQEAKAPFQRMADRYAVWFTPLTLLVAAGAAALAGDMQRFLAVLVVATPCPLILAPPIAIIGGINRGAKRQIIFRTGGAMERLAQVDTAVFDKTGTLTIGKPVVSDVTPLPPFTRVEVLQRAGSVEQGSSHLLARTLVDAAIAERITLARADDTIESPGRGVTGRVDGTTVAVGSRGFLADVLGAGSAAATTLTTIAHDGLQAYVAIDGALAGIVTYADRPRAGIDKVLAALRALGVRRTILLSGDHDANARAVATAVGINEAQGDLAPDDKVAVVRALVAKGSDVLMIGDGTNDAPALSAASVGIALAGHGGGVTAEAADAVILIDDVGRVADAVRISQRTMRIARQSVWAGLVLSGVAMGIAAFGYIAPTVGALLQEAIDVAVVLNALRASAPHRYP